MSKKHLIWIASYVPPLFYGLMFLKGGFNYFLHRVHDDDFLFFKNCKELGEEGEFIDIGGNFGQSALSYSIIDRKRHIISFEPNKTLEPYLKYVRQLLGHRYRYFLIGIGNEPSRSELYAPKLNNVVLTGEASFDHDEVESDMVRERVGLPYSITKTECEIARLDDLVEAYDLHPYIIKIDIQGFELPALTGMPKVIEKFRPVFMMEKNNDSQFLEITDFFSNYRYRILFYDARNNTLLKSDPRLSYGSNFFAIPEEMVQHQFKDLLR